MKDREQIESMERRTSDLNKRPPDDATPSDGDAIARAQKVAKTSSELRLGEVVEWNARVGYGFIQRDELGPTVFLHHTALADGVLTDELCDGARVQFEVAPPRAGERAERAYNVRVIPTQPAHSAPAPTMKTSGMMLMPRAVAARLRPDRGSAATAAARRIHRDPEASVVGYF